MDLNSPTSIDVSSLGYEERMQMLAVAENFHRLLTDRSETIVKEVAKEIIARKLVLTGDDEISRLLQLEDLLLRSISYSLMAGFDKTIILETAEKLTPTFKSIASAADTSDTSDTSDTLIGMVLKLMQKELTLLVADPQANDESGSRVQYLKSFINISLDEAITNTSIEQKTAVNIKSFDISDLDETESFPSAMWIRSYNLLQVLEKPFELVRLQRLSYGLQSCLRFVSKSYLIRVPAQAVVIIAAFIIAGLDINTGYSKLAFGFLGLLFVILMRAAPSDEDTKNK